MIANPWTTSHDGLPTLSFLVSRKAQAHLSVQMLCHTSHVFSFSLEMKQEQPSCFVTDAWKEI